MTAARIKVRHVDLYHDEWLGGTIGLTNAERGLYITACALIYSQGGPISIDVLKAACVDHKNAVNRQLERLIALGKLTLTGVTISNERAGKELEKARKRSRNGRENNAKRWKNNDIDGASAILHGNANQGSGFQPEPEPLLETKNPNSARAREGVNPAHAPSEPKSTKPNSGEKTNKKPPGWGSVAFS